jgi:hypothetical protein
VAHKLLFTFAIFLALSTASCDLERRFGKLEEDVPYEFELLMGVEHYWSASVVVAFP